MHDMHTGSSPASLGFVIHNLSQQLELPTLWVNLRAHILNNNDIFQVIFGRSTSEIDNILF